MQEVYISLEEAADLEGAKYNSFVQKIQRDKENKFVTKTVKTGECGRDRVLVTVASLSKSARDAYAELQKMKQLMEPNPELQEEVRANEAPWYVDVDLDWFIENNKTAYYKAVELSNIIKEFLNYDDKNRSQYAEEFAQEYLGKGQRTLYRYVKAYLGATAWSIKKSKEDGKNYEFFKILSLCRKPKQEGEFPSFTPEVKRLIKNIWFNKEFAANKGTYTMLYDKLEEISKLNHWERIPSYQSVARYITYLMEDEKMANAWYLASEGSSEYKNHCMLKATRDTTQLQVMEIVQGDEHTFDCWVKYTHPNGKVTAIKPKLVAWIDTRSKAILGDVICKDPNSDILKHSVLKMIYTEIGGREVGAPKYLYIDNGKDYTSEQMTGRKRNDRNSRKSLIDGGECFDIEFDDATRGFYKSIGIVDDHRAMPYEPWSKGQIERFFGGVCNRFTKWMTSYTGTLTGSKTIAKINKNIKKMLENDQLLTMDEFYACWSQWLNDKYMNHVHSYLKKHETYKTPMDLFVNGERYFKAAPPRRYATMLMMKSESVRVYQTGIHRFGQEYRAIELADYIDKYVDIKYDPDDVTTIYVYDKKGRCICEAVSQELLLIAPQVSQKALTAHLKMQKTQIRNDREKLEDANRPFTELNDEYVGFDPVTGGIDLMIGKNQNNAPKKTKVVALPDDRTYRNNEDVRKKEKEEPVQQSQFLNLQAERSLRKLRAIGEE